MPSYPTLTMFAVAALTLLVIPGPSVLYIVTRSVAQGRRAGLASVLGIALGSLVHTVVAAFGLSAILMASALAFSIVKYVGAAYLVYLGIRTLLAQNKHEGDGHDSPRSHRQLFLNGFWVQLLNPKTALFFYAFLPQFVNPSGEHVVQQILLLGILFVLMAFCTDSSYALISSGVGRLVMRQPGFQKIQRYVTGGIYIGLGVAAASAGNGRK